MKKTNETGRSMVEMLGVLAIIGVLSVGGIMGYTRAMRTWRANEVIEATNRMIVIAEVESSDGAKTTYNTALGITEAGKGVTQIAGGIVKEIEMWPFTNNTADAGKVKITWKDGYDPTDINKDICEKLGGTENCNGNQKLAGYAVTLTGVNVGDDDDDDAPANP